MSGKAEPHEPANISLIRPISERYCPKTSNGGHSRRFRRERASPFWSAIRPNPGPTWSGSRCRAARKLMPHKHPEDRIYTVMSGVFYIGLGEAFDGDNDEGLSARQRHRAARRDLAFPLGEVRRIRHAGLGDRSAWPRISQGTRRSLQSACQNRLYCSHALAMEETTRAPAANYRV